jgi:hypothetical protein
MKLPSSGRRSLLLSPLALSAGSAMAAAAGKAGKAGAVAPRLLPAELPHARCLDMASRHTGQQYRLWLGLPDGPAPAAGYPVLLALDGQAAFALLEPGRLRPEVRHPFRRMKLEGQRPGLVVGIGYASLDAIDVDARALDYTPPDAGCAPCDKLSPRHGGADRFLDFIETELLPQLAQLFRIDPEALTLFGHSYGGLFTLHALTRRPRLFARYWASSPSLWYADHFPRRTFVQRLAQLERPATARRLHVCTGLLEQQGDPQRSAERNARLLANRMVDNARELVTGLRREWPALQLSHAELAGHDHGAMFMHSASEVLEFAFGS